MKRVMAIIILALIWLIGTPVSAASTDNFYFSDFTGDYYLGSNEDGTSYLKVRENVTAVFPEYNQNKGICRQIPYTNQDGNNLVLPSLTRNDIIVTRNGLTEPIYSIDKIDNFYNVCTGNDDYVLGAQTYTFEYKYTNVVTEFNENGRIFQELYWDTNGNGALQRFDKVTARLHFDNMDVWTGESWCYVGKYGESGRSRCEITKLDDGVQFVSVDLSSFENLTFDVELKANSFKLPALREDYTYIWIALGVGAFCAVMIGLAVKKYLSTRKKILAYKNTFVKPEFQPSKEFTLPEMTEVFIGKKKNYRVPMLLDLIVRHKIELQKVGEKSWRNNQKWNIIVKNLTDVTEEYIDLLTIINDGERPEVGTTIAVRNHTANGELIALSKAIEKKITDDLKHDGLVESKYVFGRSNNSSIGDIIIQAVFFSVIALFAGAYIMSYLIDMFNLDHPLGRILVFRDGFMYVVIPMVVITVVVCTYLYKTAVKYSGYTLNGLKMSRYMDGLKLYIGMAEAERIRFLQSVNGADTSSTGIVKLYEKLLPYAAVFGLEESWLKEMKEYCEVKEIEEPDYLLMGLAISDITRGLNNVASVAAASSTMSSSGGSSSSGFSGGGGGGFSGGGGGGGGFSGR